MAGRRRVNIATSLNSKYMRYAYVMLTSFFVNQSEGMDVHVYLLYSYLTEEDKEELEGLVKSYSGTLHWLPIDREMFAQFKTTEDWSAEAYYRLLLIDILQEDVDRLLYLDVDTIVNKPLDELYEIDFGGNVLCACKDICEAPFGDQRDAIFAEQIKNHFTYFCSGVVLFHIREMRGRYCFRDYLDAARQLDYKMVAPDQDILNYIHWKETMYVDQAQYNLFAWIAYINGTHYQEVKEKASIIHFSGPKPWAGRNVRYDIEQIWWDYARKTPFYYDLLEECLSEALHNPMIYLEIEALKEQAKNLAKGLTETTKLCQRLYDMAEQRSDRNPDAGAGRVREKKICFIICANNRLYYEECAWYIHNLHVPSGYEIDIVCVTEAESMAEGYNAAMRDSDAKYKVYLHQDVFIYNRHFIEDILEIFQKDNRIGLIGVIGGIHLPQNAVIWNAWNLGMTYGCDYVSASCVKGFQSEDNKWTEAEAVDGMLMVTQYDIEWREDLMLGWDFYDISQSLEFRRRGNKIAVPYQKEPWCMHDCGNSKLIHYDEIRKKILSEYKDFFSEGFRPEYDLESVYAQEEIFEIIKVCLQQGKFEEALEIRAKLCREKIKENNLQYALNMLEIYLAEKKRDCETQSFFADVATWDEIRDKYDEIKFIVRHAENGTNEEAVETLRLKIEKKEISPQAIKIIAIHSAVDRNCAINRLLNVK